jgi:HK97 gp10 family phage protein
MMTKTINGSRSWRRRCFDVEVKVEGLDNILKNLMKFEIDEELENKALNKAGKITQNSIQEGTPLDDGTLKKNIRLRRAKDGEVTIHTGGAYHAHLVEFGRSEGSTTLKNGRRVTWGATTPNPFFSRGHEQSKSEAMNGMIEEIKRGLNL